MIDSRQMTRDLIDYVADQVSTDGPLTPYTDLLRADILDSLLMMDLVAYVEATYDVRLEDSEISPRHFRTIDGVVRLLAGKVGGRLVDSRKSDATLCCPREVFPAAERASS